MEEERRLRIAQTGHLSEIVLNHFSSTINQRKWTVMNKLIGLYRGGDLTHDLVIGAIGEIAALEDLYCHLESDVKKSRNADKNHLS